MEEEKICLNCKHWKREIEEVDSKKFGYCSCDKFSYKDNIEPNNAEEYINKLNSKHLLYWDYEDYSANFATNENFGCINFEK